MSKYLFATLVVALSLGILNAAAPHTEQKAVVTEVQQSDDDIQDVLYVGQPHPVMMRLRLRVDRKPALAHWDDCMAKYFAFLDRNNSKELERTEITKAPTATGMLQFFQGNLFIFTGRGNLGGTASLTDFDTDRDGKVTLDEFKDYYRKNNAGPISLGNANANYYYNPNGQQSTSTDAVFDLLDSDRDGKLSKKEVAVAESVFMRYDSDDNELVTSGELGLAAQNRGIRRPVDQQAQVLPQQRQPQQQQSNLILLPREEGKRAAGKLAVARDLITRYDKDKDGSVSVEEIGLPKKQFSALDRNSDGKLSALEMVRWLTGKPAGEFSVGLSDQSGAMMAPQRGGRGMPAPVVKGKEMTVSLEGVRINVVPQVSTGMRFGIDTYLVQLFNQADTEKKGFLTRRQVEGDGVNSYLRGLFDQADRDNDGKLTEKEVKALVSVLNTLRGVQVNLSLSSTGNGLFQMLDANGDSRLSLREMRTASTRLATLDKDSDGFVTRSEFPQQFQLSITQGTSSGGFIAQPINGGMRDTPQPRGRGPIWFGKMDRNGDGDISRAEWLGETDDFDAIDSDKDNLISAEEAADYDAKVRK